MRLPQKSGLLVATLLVTSSLFARTETLTVSVRGQVAPDYQRTKLADGTFKPERYVVSNGGKFPGTTTDASMDKVGYPEIAGVAARHLAGQQYYLAQKTKDADLLIAIYWGTTVTPDTQRSGEAINDLAHKFSDMKLNALEGGSLTAVAGMEFAMARIEMENQMRDSANLDNAKILGYLDAINDRREMVPWTDIGNVQGDLISDVEEERYYIVVRAYDFKALQKDGKQVVRWVTRISIGSQGQAFDERFAQMVAAGADAFGRKQDLRRRFYGDPRVDLGELKFIGATGSPATQNAANETKKD